MVDNWREQRGTESNNPRRARINAVAALIQCARARSYANLVPPTAPKTERSAYMPHAFADEELTNFFDACDRLAGIVSPASRSRRITVPVFFRLLCSGGMRTTEARLLGTGDIDLERGIISVRLAKGYCRHFIALHDSMTELLRKYDAAIREIHPPRPYFFLQAKTSAIRQIGQRRTSRTAGLGTTRLPQSRTSSCTTAQPPTSIVGSTTASVLTQSFCISAKAWGIA
jgi:integrase